METNYNKLTQTTKGIETSFTKMKFLTLSCLVAMVVCAIGCVYFSVSKVADMENQIYILDKGQAMTATRQDVSLTRADEIKAQSEKLHSLLFNLVPDYGIIRKQLEMALEISDKSVYSYYNTLQEKDFYKKLYNSAASQWIQVDSVRTDLKKYPYPVVTYATLWQIRESVMSKSSVVSTCNMVDVPRTQKNLNGLLIEKFDVIENKPLEQRQRR